jgi:hypothetical protein
MIKTRDEIGKLMTLKGYKLAAEIGVQRGDYAKKILSNWDGHLFLFDSWRNFPTGDYVDVANVSDEDHKTNLNACLDNLSEYDGRYTLCRALSPEVSQHFKDESFDLIYIDANHSYEGCLLDIEGWIKKIKLGGCICGHDYLDGSFWGGNFGVKRAVLDFFGKNPDIITNESEPSWFVFV